MRVPYILSQFKNHWSHCPKLTKQWVKVTCLLLCKHLSSLQNCPCLLFKQDRCLSAANIAMAGGSRHQHQRTPDSCVTGSDAVGQEHVGHKWANPELKPKLLGFQEDNKSRHYTNAWSPAYSPNIAGSGIRFLVKKLRSVLTQLTIEGGWGCGTVMAERDIDFNQRKQNVRSLLY